MVPEVKFEYQVGDCVCVDYENIHQEGVVTQLYPTGGGEEKAEPLYRVLFATRLENPHLCGIQDNGYSCTWHSQFLTLVEGADVQLETCISSLL